ncbi:MAG: hypothetical protein PHG44_09695, partial [Lentisphaeria bacterium]|nr:hypothetical protein [Lentisphaeria bacterium]
MAIWHINRTNRTHRTNRMYRTNRTHRTNRTYRSGVAGSERRHPCRHTTNQDKNKPETKTNHRKA